MKPRSYTSTGIILSKRNLGEADKIITIFSKDFGKIAFVAKGVRRPKSRKRGHLEIFNLIKFQGISGKSMDILTEAEVIEDFASIRKSLKKISLAYYFCEIVAKITNENEGNYSIFELLLSHLKSLKSTTKLKVLRLDFVHKILIMTGYHPDGEGMINHDLVLDAVIERQANSFRVGKLILQ